MRYRASFAQSILRVVILLVAPSVFVGCGPKGPELGNVKGTVTLDGKPIPDLKLEFVPVKGQESITGEPEKIAEPDLAKPKSVGTTNANGEFELAYDRGGQKGALLGWHMVVFPEESKQKLPPQYSSGEPSALDYVNFKKVEPGDNDFKIELRSN